MQCRAPAAAAALHGNFCPCICGVLPGSACDTIFLEVGETNDPAGKLYARAGFREVSRRPNYYPGSDGNPITALVLRRDLA